VDPLSSEGDGITGLRNVEKN